MSDTFEILKHEILENDLDDKFLASLPEELSKPLGYYKTPEEKQFKAFIQHPLILSADPRVTSNLESTFSYLLTGNKFLDTLFPSKSLMASFTGVSEKTIQRSLKSLSDLDLIYIVRRNGTTPIYLVADLDLHYPKFEGYLPSQITWEVISRNHKRLNQYFAQFYLQNSSLSPPPKTSQTPDPGHTCLEPKTSLSSDKNNNRELRIVN